MLKPRPIIGANISRYGHPAQASPVQRPFASGGPGAMRITEGVAMNCVYPRALGRDLILSLCLPPSSPLSPAPPMKRDPTIL